MILVVGGIASGKRTFARTLGVPEERMALDVHERVRAGVGTDTLLDELASAEVVTCAEVGSGVVPLDAAERAWRDEVGRLAAGLASRAEVVVRMACGIPVVLKGDQAHYRATVCPGQERDNSDEALTRADSDPVMCLVLIRHGQTPGNAARRYVGAIDEPLSAAGREQARAAGPHPGVGRVYVSRMRRARETAELMFPNAEQVVVPGIEEMDFGAFGGRTADEMEDDAAYREWVEGGCEGRCPGGESRAEFCDRVCAALVQLCRDAAARGENRVVVVAHGGTQMAFLSRFAPEPRGYYDWLTGNCEGWRLDVRLEPDAISLASGESPIMIIRQCQY